MLNILEVDVLSQNELRLAVELAVKHRIPALIVNQALVGEAIMLRIARQGRFKIFTSVDYPKGENYNMLKLRGMVASSIQADGFEIVLTLGCTPEESLIEAKTLAEFFKTQVNKLAEVRFVLHMLHHEEASIEIYKTLLDVRRPAMVRTDCKTKTQIGKQGMQIHQEMVKKLKSIGNLPIKISGNITSWRALQECKIADRVGVSLAQLESIIKDSVRTPSEIKELLI